jgi:hypothetical protein
VGERATEVVELTYMRTWRVARRRIFTEEVAAGPLAATPYALRHACVSTWLNGGVPATQIAEWAGHSVEVLLNLCQVPRRAHCGPILLGAPGKELAYAGGVVVHRLGALALGAEMHCPRVEQNAQIG